MESAPAAIAPTEKPAPAGAAVPFAATRANHWCLVFAAWSSGALLWLCYHPVAWGFLGWVALVPFLSLVRAQARPRFLYLCAWGTGLVFFFAALQWMRVADYRMYATWAMLAVYCSFYLPAALWLIRLLDRTRLPLVVSVPVVWVALEYLRCFLLTGFTWYLLAHTQHNVLTMIQVTDLGGVFLVTFLVAAVNGFVFDCAYQWPEVRRWFRQSELPAYRQYASVEILNRSFMADWLFRRNLILEGLALAVVLACAYAYGVHRLGENHFFHGPMVSLLQSDLDQRIRNDLGDPDKKNEARNEETVQKHYAALCTRAVRDYPPPDLIIWPETSFPHEWVEVSPKLAVADVPEIWRNAAIDIHGRLHRLGARYTHIPHLLGMNANFLDEKKQHRRYNSALFLNADGQVQDRFDKMHRIPFGEYVPLKDWLPFMNAFAPYDFDYSIQPGNRFTRFKVTSTSDSGERREHRFGTLICFEDTDPFLARRYMQADADGPPVDFLVNISNDGWFDGTSEHEEHLAASRFRAIECRRAMVRAVNMGISALIDSNGRVLKCTKHPGGTPQVWEVHEGETDEMPAADWHRFKKVAGVLKATIPIDRRVSLYTLAGDWFSIGCWLVVAGVVAWSMLSSRRRLT